MRVVLLGMYPTEAFGMGPLMLMAAIRARPELGDVRVDVEFAQGDEGSYPVEELTRRVVDRAPQVVGIGCYLWNRSATLELATELRRRLPGALLVVGGPEVETCESAAAVLREAPFDVAVRGEGELVFAELLARYRTGTLESDWPRGTSVWQGDGLHHEPEAIPADPLDVLPTPFDSGLADFSKLHRIPGFETYRGCIMRCKFCNWGKSRGMRFFGLDRVLRDLSFILELNVERIWFVDAVFNLKPERSKVILRHLVENNVREIRFDFEMMAELLDDEQIDWIARFPEGSSIAFGLQSTDPAVVREAQRPHNWRRFSTAIRKVRERAPQVEVAIDLIYGLPKDRPEAFRRSLLQTVDLDPTRIQVHPFRVLVGTRFWDARGHYGFRDMGSVDHLLSAERGMTVDDMRQYRWIAYWAVIFNSPRHRRLLDKLHRLSGTSRSIWLERFMEEHERELGRVYYDELEPGELQAWRHGMRRVHGSLLGRTPQRGEACRSTM